MCLLVCIKLLRSLDDKIINYFTVWEEIQRFLLIKNFVDHLVLEGIIARGKKSLKSARKAVRLILNPSYADGSGELFGMLTAGGKYQEKLFCLLPLGASERKLLIGGARGGLHWHGLISGRKKK